MTLSSSASHGMLNGGGSESAMPKGKWSDSSSDAGVGRKMTDLQRTLKGFAEPSEDSRSMDEEDSMVDSSEGASITNKGKPGRISRQKPDAGRVVVGGQVECVRRLHQGRRQG